MKTEIKNKWIGALTSGDYKQTVGALGRYNDTGQDTFCCLGVLCDVLMDDDKAPVVLENRGEEFGQPEHYMKFNGDERHVLPEVVSRFVGLKDRNPIYTFEVASFEDAADHDPETGRLRWLSPFDDRGTEVDLDLASLNDEGFTFSQIADIINWAEPSE